MPGFHSPSFPTDLLTPLGLMLPPELSLDPSSPPEPPEPPDPPDPPSAPSSSVVSPPHSPHLNLPATLAVNDFGFVVLTSVSFSDKYLAFRRVFAAVCSPSPRNISGLPYYQIPARLLFPLEAPPLTVLSPHSHVVGRFGLCGPLECCALGLFPIISLSVYYVVDALWEGLRFTEEDVISKSIREARVWIEAFVPPPSSCRINPGISASRPEIYLCHLDATLVDVPGLCGLRRSLHEEESCVLLNSYHSDHLWCLPLLLML